MIDQFTEQYRWLSNFYPVEIEYDNIIYPSIEHYYVAMKIDGTQQFTIDGDNKSLNVQDARKFISEIETPGKAKRVGHKDILIRKDWTHIKISIMEYGLQKKFSQEPFRTKLLQTDRMEIQEGNHWNDRFWGVDLNTGEGKNILGKMIMKIRETLK